MKKRCARDVPAGTAYCILHSPDRTKDETAFESALALELAKQEGNKILDIRGFVFPTFFDILMLPWEPQGVDAHGAVFEDTAVFTRISFTDKVDFSKAVFNGKAHFENARFASITNFRNCTFNNTVDFSGVRFDFGVDFNASKLKYAIFEMTEFNNFNTDVGRFGKQFHNFADFTHSQLQNAEFRDVCLTSSRFNNCIGLDTCRFYHVRWREKHDNAIIERFIEWTGWGRWTLLDEKIARNPHITILNSSRSSLEATETTYRELKVNYESHKNYPDAGHFHYGEMEMRRLAKVPGSLQIASVWALFSLIGWYWLISGYGERAWRSIAAFAVVIFMAAQFYSAQGFIVKEPVLSAIKNNQPMNEHFENSISHSLTEASFLSLRVALVRADAFFAIIKSRNNRGHALRDDSRSPNLRSICSCRSATLKEKLTRLGEAALAPLTSNPVVINPNSSTPFSISKS